MPEVNTLLQEYIELRDKGLPAEKALGQLRAKVEGLARAERSQLSEAIRRYEGRGDSKPRIKRLARADRPPEQPEPTEKTVICWNCGKPNRQGEILCVHCGALLKQVQQPASTRQLHTEDHKPEYFSKDSTLLMHVRHSGDMIKMRPQEADHEMVIGRADTNNTVKPDIDLSIFGAEEMGVSRLHMSVAFDEANERLLIMDMGSANGVYVNGQKLVAKEERVLRDGDQLRLGQLVLDAAYRHEPA